MGLVEKEFCSVPPTVWGKSPVTLVEGFKRIIDKTLLFPVFKIMDLSLLSESLEPILF